MFGIRVPLKNDEKKLDFHVYVPSLSSIQFYANNQMIDFTETDPTYSRMPIHKKLAQVIPKDGLCIKQSSYIAVLFSCQKGQSLTSFLVVSNLASGALIGVAPMKAGKWWPDMQDQTWRTITFLKNANCCSYDLSKLTGCL